MSYTSAILKVIYLFEKCAPLPISVDIKQKTIIDSHHYQNKYFKLFLQGNTLLVVFILFPFFVCHLIWLLSHWKSYTAYNTVEAVIYALCTFIVIIVLTAFYTLTTDSARIKYIINQRCYITPEPTNDLNRLFNIPLFKKITFYELLIYGSATVILLTLPAISVGPFIFPFCPLQLIFGTSFFVKICAGLYYTLLTIYSVFLCFTLIMLNVSILEGVIIYSSSIYGNDITFKHERYKWKKCLTRFRVICIFIKSTDNIYGVFHTVLILVGVLVASCGGYIIMMMFDKVPLIIYIGALAITFVCLFIAIVLTLVAQIPYKRAIKFTQYWKYVLKRKEDKMLLKCCRHVGFEDFIYGLYTAKLGLLICDDIVQNTVNLVLLNG